MWTSLQTHGTTVTGQWAGGTSVKLSNTTGWFCRHSGSSTAHMWVDPTEPRAGGTHHNGCCRDSGWEEGWEAARRGAVWPTAWVSPRFFFPLSPKLPEGVESIVCGEFQRGRCREPRAGREARREGREGRCAGRARGGARRGRRGGRGREAAAAAAGSAMAFEALAEAAERWCARTPFQLIAAEETERRMDFYAEPGVSFYVLCPEAACGDNFVSAPWGDRGSRACGAPPPRLCVDARGALAPLRDAPSVRIPRAREEHPRGSAGGGGGRGRAQEEGMQWWRAAGPGAGGILPQSAKWSPLRVGGGPAGRAAGRDTPPPPSPSPGPGWLRAPGGRGWAGRTPPSAPRPAGVAAAAPSPRPLHPHGVPGMGHGRTGRAVTANGEWAGIKWSQDDRRAAPPLAAPPGPPRDPCRCRGGAPAPPPLA